MSSASVPWVVVKLITWDWTVTLSLSGEAVSRQERKAMRLELAAYPGHWGKKTTPFLIFFLPCFNPPVCLCDLSIWLRSQTHSIRAKGHQYHPMWRYWESNGYSFCPLFTMYRREKIIWQSYIPKNTLERQFTTFFTMCCFQKSIHSVLMKKLLITFRFYYTHWAYKKKKCVFVYKKVVLNDLQPTHVCGISYYWFFKATGEASSHTKWPLACVLGCPGSWH